MRRSTILLGVLFVFIAQLGFGQGDVKVTSGVLAYQQQDFEKALKYLNEALENPGGLKSKNVPKAYFHRAKSRLGAMAMAAQKGDMEKVEKYANAPLEAVKDFQLAKQNDDGKWGKKIDVELNNMYNTLLQGGLTAYNLSLSGEMSKEDKKQALGMAKEYLETAISINADYYVAHDLLGQTLMASADTVNSKKSFKAALEKFDAKNPANPDQLVGYIYYRLALISRYSEGNLDEALKYVEGGLKAVEDEHGRINAKKADYTPEQLSKLDEQYNGVVQDLNSFKLDIYLNSPDKLQEALKEFEDAIQKDPTNYVKHVAYANMLEKVDQDKAITMYKKAIELDNTKEIAPFNLGALYNNIAKEWYDKANEEEDYKKSEELTKKGNEAFKQALPYFEMAHKINPQSVPTVRALKQISVQLNDMDAFAKYKALEKELTGG